MTSYATQRVCSRAVPIPLFTDYADAEYSRLIIETDNTDYEVNYFSKFAQ